MAYRRPESVLVLVYADCANVLVLRRVRPFDFWQSVTGCLDAGETPACAARREVLEETGITAVDRLENTGIARTFEIDGRWRARYAPGVTANLEHEFRLRVPAPQAVCLDRAEHSSCEWVDIDTALERVWSWTNREALERLRREL